MLKIEHRSVVSLVPYARNARNHSRRVNNGSKTHVAVEAMLHAFFHKKRIRGEWFNLDERDIAYIDSAMDCVDKEINNGRETD